jgi:hypothetical protein
MSDYETWLVVKLILAGVGAFLVAFIYRWRTGKDVRDLFRKPPPDSQS